MRTQSKLFCKNVSEIPALNENAVKIVTNNCRGVIQELLLVGSGGKVKSTLTSLLPSFRQLKAERGGEVKGRSKDGRCDPFWPQF